MSPENEISPPPAETPPPVTSSAAEPTAPVGQRASRFNPWLVVALAAIGLAAWQWIETRQSLLETQQQVARRLADADASVKEAQGAQKQLREQLESVQAKFGAIEGKLAEFQGQSESLQALYQDLARSREEATLLEVEQAITLASQQLQLAGNVQVAVLALQTADSRLANLDRPQYLPLRKAIGRDLARINAMPQIDTSGMSLRLEQVLLGVDKLPLAADGRPSAKTETPPQAAPTVWWQRAGSEIWQEVKGLVRIQRFDRNDPVLLAPGQSFFLRENLKLRLLNARVALLSRDHRTFRNELKVAQEWLARHFDRDDKSVKSALAALQTLAATELDAEIPNLNESLENLRLLRKGKEKR